MKNKTIIGFLIREKIKKRTPVILHYLREVDRERDHIKIGLCKNRLYGTNKMMCMTPHKMTF